MWLGAPSVFVRVSGCNLRCRWCDTPYASWEPEGPVLELTQILAKVAEARVRHVVLTGGEPMLFDAIVPLAQELSQRGHLITIETAGTIFREVSCDLMSISPKLAHSAPDEASSWKERHEESRLNFNALKSLTSRYNYQLKFVANPEGTQDDIGEITKVIEGIGGVDPERVMLMAEGRDTESLHRRERLLLPTCLQKGWRLTPRYQIDLFGDTRGT